MDGRRAILLISGSLRDGSTNTALLRTAGPVAPANVTTTLYDGMGRRRISILTMIGKASRLTGRWRAYRRR